MHFESSGSFFRPSRPIQFVSRSFLHGGPCRTLPCAGGDKRDRTVDLLLAKQALSQLSYTPMFGSYSTVGPSRFSVEVPSLSAGAVRKLSRLTRRPVLSVLNGGPCLQAQLGAFKIKQRFRIKVAVTDLWMLEQLLHCSCLHRKEVIQPHLPIRLPCYDFTPVANPTFGGAFLAVRLPTSGITGSHGVTGGVYKARERIHRGMMIRDY